MDLPTSLTGENPHITVSMSSTYGDQWKSLHCSICGNVVCEYNNDYIRTISASGEPKLDRPGKIIQCSGVLSLHGAYNHTAFNILADLLQSILTSGSVEDIRNTALKLTADSQIKRNVRCKARYYIGQCYNLNSAAISGPERGFFYFMEPTNFLNQDIVIEQPELNTGLDDAQLNQIIDARITESKTAYDLIKLDDRRKKNRDFWKGNQVKDDDGLAYVDNVIWQDTEQRISIAVGRMPDIIVVPTSNDLTFRDRAQKLEKALDIDFSSKKLKRTIKNGLRHNHLDFIGVLKASWNPNKRDFGDYEFNLCDPRKVLISHTATIPEDGFTSDNCDLIVEQIEEPVAVLMAKFPAKSQQLLESMNSSDPSRLATTVRYQEIWYTYHDKQGQILEGVCWRYNHIILRNIRNPYFDFQGYQKVVYDRNGQPVIDIFGRQATQQVFRNFFERPRKPYILFSYQNLGEFPVDSTTAVEQAIPLQQNLNKTGKKIREISDGITNKYAFNRKVSQDQARNVTSDPREAIWVDGDDPVGTAVTSFKNDGPPPGLFNDMSQMKQQIDAKFQTHGTTRGEYEGVQSGVSKQITREGDLVSSDDIVEIVVERVVEEAASWAVQFMKLMYVDPHFKAKMGKDGDIIQEWIQRDLIDDGISLSIKGSTVDKQRRIDIASQRSQSGAIDPLTLFEDLDVPNPREQAERLLLFKLGEGPNGDGFARYMQFAGLDPNQNNTQPTQPTQPVQPAQPQNPNALALLQQQMPMGAMSPAQQQPIAPTNGVPVATQPM